MPALLLLIVTKLKSGVGVLTAILSSLNFLQGALFILGIVLGYKLHGPIQLVLKLLRIL